MSTASKGAITPTTSRKQMPNMRSPQIGDRNLDTHPHSTSSCYVGRHSQNFLLHTLSNPNHTLCHKRGWLAPPCKVLGVSCPPPGPTKPI
jgi:hypothetical protein